MRRPGPRRTLAATATAVALVALSLGTTPAGALSANAADEPPCDTAQVPGAEALADADPKDNAAFERMHIEQAQQLARGRGTKIAVIDSGVAPVPGLDLRSASVAAGTDRAGLLSGHGTIVASLIAGPHGVAPDATIYDIKVFDTEEGDPAEGKRPVTSTGIVAGIRAVIALQPSEQFDVVNISLAVRQSDVELEKAVAELVAIDEFVVVASAGNKETDAEDPDFEGTLGNDADVYPADYPGVLAVSATPPDGDDPGNYVVPNMDTDVSAPTRGAVSVNATGKTCVIADVATSWAAAEVSGVIALLRERFPQETPKMLVARLQATTEGAGVPAVRGQRVENPWTGAGVVQAYDALTREMKPGREGKVESTVAETRGDVQAPPAPAMVDIFSTPRAIVVWVGLGAGAFLALAFMLRPLLRRRAG